MRPIDDRTNDDFERLTSMLIPHARRLIEKRQVLIPMACGIASDGSFAAITAFTPADRLTIGEMNQALTAAIAEVVSEGRVRAVAMCIDMRVEEPRSGTMTDAIAVYRSSATHAQHLMTPYQRKFLRGTVFGESWISETTVNFEWPAAGGRSS